MNLLSIVAIALSPFLLIGFFLFILKRNEKRTKLSNSKVVPASISMKNLTPTPLFYSEGMLKSRENIRYFIRHLSDEKLSESWNKVESFISSIEADDEYVEQIKKHRLNETLLQDVEKLLTVYVRMREDKKKIKHGETNEVIIHIAGILKELKDEIEDKKEDEYNRLHGLIFARE